MKEIRKKVTSVWVLQPKLKKELTDKINSSSLSEVNALTKALPYVKIIGSTIVSVEKLSPKEFFGSGKVGELAEKFSRKEIDLVIINSQISPVQQRNLEKKWKLKILDRTLLYWKFLRIER